jgi:hypothetical protein
MESAIKKIGEFSVFLFLAGFLGCFLEYSKYHYLLAVLTVLGMCCMHNGAKSFSEYAVE